MLVVTNAVGHADRERSWVDYLGPLWCKLSPLPRIRAVFKPGPTPQPHQEIERRPPWRMNEGSPEGTVDGGAPHNLRLKLSGRSGHIRQNPFTLPVAAPARSLSALRYAALKP